MDLKKAQSYKDGSLGRGTILQISQPVDFQVNFIIFIIIQGNNRENGLLKLSSDLTFTTQCTCLYSHIQTHSKYIILLKRLKKRSTRFVTQVIGLVISQTGSI